MTGILALDPEIGAELATERAQRLERRRRVDQPDAREPAGERGKPPLE